MNEDELRKAVADAAKVPASDVTLKKREGSQIKANGLWEGSCTPSSPRTRVGLMLSLGGEQLAVEGAARRLNLSDLPFPDAIIVVEKPGTEDQRAAVVGYSDSDLGPKVAAVLGVEAELVPRPVYLQVTHERRPAIDAAPLRNALESTPNVVLQGPPGTGKSSAALAFVAEMAEEAGANLEQCRYGKLLSEAGGSPEKLLEDGAEARSLPIIWEFVQLHPGYSYEDLVRRVVPAVGASGQLQMKVEDGLLPSLSRLAQCRDGKPVVLILDEINRANLASVLGEFVFALDPGHRGTPVRLQYQGAGVSASVAVPPNVLVVGTMNTADRSLAMVDYAVRRRFRFIDVPSDATVVLDWYRGHNGLGEIAEELMESCNAGLQERSQISHAAFLATPDPIATWPERLSRQVAYHVLPLLAEYDREGLRDAVPISFGDVVLSPEARKESMVRLSRTIRKRLGATGE